MTTRKIRQAETAVAEAELALNVAKLALARAEAENAMPPEPRINGTLLRFKVRYRSREQQYTYTALKVPGGWEVSGKRHAGRTVPWEEVVKLADMNYDGRAHFEDLGV